MYQIIALTLLFATVLVAVMGLFGSKNQFLVAGSTAIVTGGSQGLGLSISTLLAAKGANVVIVARDVSKLESALKAVEASATNKPKQRFLQLSFDLRAPESAAQIIDQVTAWNGDRPPEIVFNCAGNCLPGFFASSSLETHRTQMETIYWTCAYMAHATLNEWIQPASKEHRNNPSSSNRHLIFTASALAFFPIAGYAPYTPCKAAMRALADTLNQEVAVYNGARKHGSDQSPPADIKIHIAFPMGIRTPGFENEEKMKPALTRMLEEEDKPQDPDELAKIIMVGLEAGQYMITPTIIGRLMQGWSMGASQRTSILDYVWAWIGSLVILFIGPDFMAKCRKWGMQKGMSEAK